MTKETEWESVINGETYAFTHRIASGKHVLLIDGIEYTFKPGFFRTLVGADETFSFDGIEAVFVLGNRTADVAVNGVCLHSQKPYIPRPKWALVFVVLCLLIPIVSLGGAVPAVIGIAGAVICTQISKSSLPLAARTLVCTLVTLAAWGTWYSFALWMADLL